MAKLKIDTDAYKIGLDEIDGLQNAMTEVLAPVLEVIQDRVYWDKLAFEPSEYHSRDGFIPYASNCGGMELTVIVPKCESQEFDFLRFGECDTCQELFEEAMEENALQCGYHGQECCSESEGHLDAKLRVWLKFEGLENGVMNFYLVLSGGNGDAPYFREYAAKTIYESQFQAATLASFKTKAVRHIKKLLKAMA